MQRLIIRFIAIVIIVLWHNAAMAQNHTDGYSLPKINLDSLSAEDKALLGQYKDDFNREMEDILFLMDNKKHKPIDTSVYNMDHRSHAEIGLDFLSSILVNGRESGITGVGFFPSVAYLHKTGLFVGLSAGFFTYKPIVKATAVPTVSFGFGYQHLFFKRWFLAAGYSHSFITYGRPIERALLNNCFSFTTAVDLWKRLIISFGVSEYVSSRLRLTSSLEANSTQLVFSLRKDFVIRNFIGAKQFTITPAINLYFADDNQIYATWTLVNDVKGDSALSRQIKKKTLAIDKFFGLVDVEPSLTIDWRIRNLDICVTPVLAIPFNIYDAETQLRTLNPHQYHFYVTAGIKYLFAVNKKKKKR